jgi:hypothetical protein
VQLPQRDNLPSTALPPPLLLPLLLLPLLLPLTRLAAAAGRIAGLLLPV